MSLEPPEEKRPRPVRRVSAGVQPKPRSSLVYEQPIEGRVDWLRDLARANALRYSSPEAYLTRDRYIAQHPSRLLVLSCMDGRVNIPRATKTPDGIIRTFRNLGGRFDLGWPNLCDVISAAVFKAVKVGRRVLAIVTYHFSKGDHHRGCAGFHYDTEAAQRHTKRIQSQFSQLFGAGHATVYPLLAGFETDEDALILHGTRPGELLDVASLLPDEKHDHVLRGRLDVLFPDMPEEMRRDLLPLILGNITHVDAMRAAPPRVLDIEHREWVICVGRGFDWMTLPNTALIVGPYSPDLDGPIRTAARIVKANMEAGRIPEDGFLLLASFPYEDPGGSFDARLFDGLELHL